MRYFTDSPFERLMMEKPCGHSRAAEVAWERENNKNRKRTDRGAAEQEAAPRFSATRREKNP